MMSNCHKLGDGGLDSGSRRQRRHVIGLSIIPATYSDTLDYFSIRYCRAGLHLLRQRLKNLASLDHMPERIDDYTS